jgi:hypothetical protein
MKTNTYELDSLDIDSKKEIIVILTLPMAWPHHNLLIYNASFGAIPVRMQW